MIKVSSKCKSSSKNAYNLIDIELWECHGITVIAFLALTLRFYLSTSLFHSFSTVFTPLQIF